MEAIHTEQGWQKVRKLSKWKQIIPTWVYIIGAVVSGYFVFIDNNRSNRWILILIFCVARWGGKEGHEEGYVDGWDEAQDYTTSDFTLDELLEVNKPKEVKDKYPCASDKSNYRK